MTEPDPDAGPDQPPPPGSAVSQVASKPASARRAPPASRGLDVTVTDGRGRVQQAVDLCRWLVDIAPRAARGDVAIALVGDAKMRALNRQFRSVDRPTDVLAFPSDTNGHLGDIVIATGVARRQARAAGHPLATEVRCLALHGLLHLLGYDHERDDGQMARLEQRLRRRGGIA